MKYALKAAALLLAASTAMPAFAQAAPPAGPDGPGKRIIIQRFERGPDGHGQGMMGGHGGPGMMGGTLAGLTPEGRKILGDAMRDNRGGEGRDAVDAARDKMLQLLEADRLDVPALRRAMGEEHRLAEAQQQRHQEAMLAAFQKLSLRDRKAFSVGMRNQHYRMEQMRKDMDGRMKRFRDRAGRADMPPPSNMPTQIPPAR